MPHETKTTVPFDLASLTLSGNILITLVKKNMLSLDDAETIISRVKFAASIANTFRHHEVIDIDWHFDNLHANLRDEVPKD